MKIILLILLIVVLCSCTSEIELKVQKKPFYNLDDIRYIKVGSFKDLLRREIPIPSPPKGIVYEKEGILSPSIVFFRSNYRVADLIRASLISEISMGRKFSLVNTLETDFFNGSLPDQNKTGIIDCKVSYFEFFHNGSELKAFDLKSFKLQGLSSSVRLETVEKLIPYTEVIGAISVEYSLKRASTGELLIPKQTITSYYTRKWGGLEKTSSLPNSLKNMITTIYQDDEKLSNKLSNLFNKVELRLENPREFLAQGANLKKNADVPLTLLDVRSRLAKQVSRKYLKIVSISTETINVELAGGDDVGKQLVKNNAFRHAINYLEGLKDKESDDFYNLGLAYEAIGEKNQAMKYYSQALNDESGNKLFKGALKRVDQ